MISHENKRCETMTNEKSLGTHRSFGTLIASELDRLFFRYLRNFRSVFVEKLKEKMKMKNYLLVNEIIEEIFER